MVNRNRFYKIIIAILILANIVISAVAYNCQNQTNDKEQSLDDWLYENAGSHHF